jgi:hypothetical protein
MSRGSLTKEKISLRVNPPCVVHLLDEGVVLLPESHGGTIRYLLPDFKVSPILRFEKGKFYSRNRNIFRKSEIYDKWKFPLCLLILILHKVHSQREKTSHSTSVIMNLKLLPVPNLYATLQWKTHLCISFLGICAASVLIFRFMCLWAIYIFPASVYIFPAAE